MRQERDVRIGRPADDAHTLGPTGEKERKEGAACDSVADMLLL